MFFKETIDSYLQFTNQKLATLKINKTIINADTNFCFTTLAFFYFIFQGSSFNWRVVFLVLGRGGGYGNFRVDYELTRNEIVSVIVRWRVRSRFPARGTGNAYFLWPLIGQLVFFVPVVTDQKACPKWNPLCARLPALFPRLAPVNCMFLMGLWLVYCSLYSLSLETLYNLPGQADNLPKLGIISTNRSSRYKLANVLKKYVQKLHLSYKNQYK